MAQRVAFTLSASLGLGAAIFMVACGTQAQSQSFTRQPRDQARLGVGLQWNFGTSQPEIVLAARWTRSHTDASAFGGKVDLTFPVMTEFRPTLRLMGVAGARDIQGEYGFGYRFAASKVLIGLGAQAPFTNAGIDYTIGENFAAHGGVNTFGRLVGPRQVAAP